MWEAWEAGEAVNRQGAKRRGRRPEHGGLGVSPKRSGMSEDARDMTALSPQAARCWRVTCFGHAPGSDNRCSVAAAARASLTENTRMQRNTRSIGPGSSERRSGL